jgi:hypothetical protein
VAEFAKAIENGRQRRGEKHYTPAGDGKRIDAQNRTQPKDNTAFIMPFPDGANAAAWLFLSNFVWMKME